MGIVIDIIMELIEVAVEYTIKKMRGKKSKNGSNCK